MEFIFSKKIFPRVYIQSVPSNKVLLPVFLISVFIVGISSISKYRKKKKKEKGSEKKKASTASKITEIFIFSIAFPDKRVFPQSSAFIN